MILFKTIRRKMRKRKRYHRKQASDLNINKRHEKTRDKRDERGGLQSSTMTTVGREAMEKKQER